MSITNSRKGFVFGLVLFFVGVCFFIGSVETCQASIIDMGSINIWGKLDDVYVVCLTVNNSNIIVNPRGENVTIQVSYKMNCSRLFDDGYCNISFMEGGGADSTNTSTNASGYLTISKFMMPGDSFTVKLYALYYDTYGDLTLGEETQYAYGVVRAPLQPVAEFSFSPYSSTTGDVVRFIDESITNGSLITSWSWDFGDGNSSILQSPNHIYTESGSFPVTLKITDDYGQNSSKTITILVKEKGIPGFEFIIVFAGISFMLFWKRKRKTND